MSFFHDGQRWEVVDLTWDGWVAVLLDEDCPTHYRAFFPFLDLPTLSVEPRSAKQLNANRWLSLNDSYDPQAS
ncbi:MAG: hypothetical protein WCD18_15220 [Thermosynechococcaceae cyanobacterium]